MAHRGGAEDAEFDNKTLRTVCLCGKFPVFVFDCGFARLGHSWGTE
jgi:hypothetical protein